MMTNRPQTVKRGRWMRHKLEIFAHIRSFLAVRVWPHSVCWSCSQFLSPLKALPSFRSSHAHLNWLCRLICLLNRALPNLSSTDCLPSAVQIGSPDRALSWFVCVLTVFAIPRAPPPVFSIVGRIICCSDHRWTPNLSCSHILLLCTLWFLCCLSIYVNPVVHAAYSWSGFHPFFPAISHAHMFM